MSLQELIDAINADEVNGPHWRGESAWVKTKAGRAKAYAQFRDLMASTGLLGPDITRAMKTAPFLQAHSNGSTPANLKPAPVTASPVATTPPPPDGAGFAEAGAPKADRGRSEVIDWPEGIVNADDIERLEWSGPGTNLPEEFWSARPIFQHIRRAAWNRLVSGDALLGTVLTRVSAGVPHQVRIPPIVGSRVPLSLILNITGRSGAGKSSANAVGIELVPLGPDVIDEMPIGSGEGLIEMLFEWETQEGDKPGKVTKVKVQKYRNAYVYVDEGAAALALSERKDSVILPTIRTIYSGGVLGQTNASQDTKRRVPAGEHTFGIVIAIQETVAAALLEHEGDGTPQRFLWLSADDPAGKQALSEGKDPEWPGGLAVLDFLRQREATGDVDDETVAKVKGGHAIGYMMLGKPYDLDVAPAIRKEIRDLRIRSLGGDANVDPLRAHENLTRLKVAGCFAILDQRVDISEDDWRLAGMVMTTSNAVLARTRKVIADDEARKDAKTSKRAARRQVVVATALDERADRLKRVEACARWLRNRTESAPGVTVTDLKRTVAKRLRDVFDDGLARAVKLGWIEERSESGSGLGSNQKRALYPLTKDAA